MRSRLAALAIGIAVAACARSAADHEELGDRAYAAGNHTNALAEYRLALLANPGRAALHAKAAAAAVRTEDFSFAMAEYRALAMADRGRLGEATRLQAQGLQSVWGKVPAFLLLFPKRVFPPQAASS